MNVLHTRLTGLTQTPFTFIHVSDTHFCLADDRDGKRKTDLARGRRNCFPRAGEALEEGLRLAKEKNTFVLHTGDMSDFVSLKNLEKAKEITDNNELYLAAGNHEFSLYVGEAKEDAAYREQSLTQVQAAFSNDIRFCSVVKNGVNFVLLDNSYYLIEPWQLAALKSEAQKSLPVILCVHTPLYCEELAEKKLLRDGYPLYVMGAPEKELANYSPDRYEQQKADETTTEAFDFIASCPNIRAIFAGHLHFDTETSFFGKPQIVTGTDTVRITEIG